MKYYHLLASAAGGIAAGYLAAHLILKRKYELQASIGIKEAHQFYREYFENKLTEADQNSDELSVSLEVADESLAVYSVGSEDIETVFPPSVPVVKKLPPTDYNAISMQRKKAASIAMTPPMMGGNGDPYAPYVISEADYNIGMDEWNQSITLVYYTDDDILADAMDNTVMDEFRLEKFITRGNLECFGEKSGEPDTVYVRCPTHKTDFEITQSHESYTKATGLPIPMRGGDDG